MRSSVIIRIAIISLLLITCAVVSASAQSGPLVWYKFDEASGLSALDSSGNGKTATLASAAAWTPGVYGNSVDLTGTSTSYVTLPTGIVSSLTDFTICAWVKLDTISNWSRIFDFGSSTTVNMFLTPKNGTSNVVRFGITTSGGSGEQQINGTSALPTGVWKHVAVTLSGTTGILYVDGVEVGRNSSMTRTPSAMGSSTKNYIGRSQYPDPYLDGKVDDFRIYGRALSPAEISEVSKIDNGCIGKVKKQAIGSSVSLGNKIVTGAFLGYFYIQDPEAGHTSCGIKVVHSSTQALGNVVSVSGALAKDSNDELIIQATSVTSAAGSTSPNAMGCNNRSIGGGTQGSAQGPDGGAGINMVGVLQVTWGKVSNLVKDASFTIDDGSKCPVKVYGPTDAIANGDTVRVRGISSIEKEGGVRKRVLRMRNLMDLIGGFESAGSVLVYLDARSTGSTPGTWANLVPGLGDFTQSGAPALETIGGQLAMTFDGADDTFVGPVAPSSLTGRSTRTIEVWAYNPMVASEETLVAWGKRGSTALNCSFNYGGNTTYGAATHWAADLGWNGTPGMGRWHHMVYTYDGTTVRVYNDTLLKNSRTVTLSTSSGQRINLAAQNDASGNPNSIMGSLSIAMVRIHTGVLTQAQIDANFDLDAKRFGAKREVSALDRLNSTVTLNSGELTVKLLADALTPVSLSPNGSTFDFTPGDRLSGRVSDGYYHLGDITLRTRTAGGAWQSFTSASSPANCTPVAIANGYAVDVTPALGLACPLKVERRWVNENGRLILRLVLTNQSAEPVELGSLGTAMVFNNLFTNRSLVETHEKCSFTDPYIGGDAGYIQVTRVNGAGPALIVYPEPGTGFEAFRHLRQDPTGLSVTFEGFYEWMVHTRAHAEQEWAGVNEWNTPTSKTLAPGESTTYGYVFTLSPDIKSIENTLIARSRPVAVGVPGYVLTMDQPGRLFVKHSVAVQSMIVEPDGAISVNYDGPTPGGWQAYTLSPSTEGWSRLVITYEDGSKQFVHYNTVASQSEQVERLANFHETHQWYTNLQDPFHRAYSYMLYDRESDIMRDQESRQFCVGESDEVGAGPNLLMAMKNFMKPDPTQVQHLEMYVDNVLWGNLQYTNNYGIKASLFYWDPDEFPGYYTVGAGWGWDKARCDTTWRSYNYPHQAAIYWALYRIARNYPGLVTHHTWDWYLSQAYKTGLGMRDLGGYNDKGLMDGTVFLEILKDMKREGWTSQLTAYEAFFKGRADAWSLEAYPFGSEMPWDSTGQEEVYMWTKYYGYPSKALESVNAILAYTPTVPNWSYNGAARRYWDSSMYGKIPIIARQSGHYGSSLNAIPVVDMYRDNPSDFYMLRVGYGANMNILPNINEEGHGSQNFLMEVTLMDFEPYTGDFGSAFFGYAYNSAAYAVYHADFGWLGFGAVITGNGSIASIEPRDAFRKRVYVGPLGLWLTLDSGTFERVDYDTATGAVTAVLSPATTNCPVARLSITRPGQPTAPAYAPTTTFPTERGCHAIPLGTQPTSVTLTP